MALKSQQPWYTNGLAFECQACGRCCCGPEEGYVWVTADDIKAMAQELTMSVAAFKKQYVRRIGMRTSLMEKQPSKDCVLLTSGKTGKLCRVYHQRPIQCSTWPFWKENLKSPETWAYAGLKCPGIDQGQWHSLERIEAILAGNYEQAPPPMDFWQMIKKRLADFQIQPAGFSALTELYGNLDRHIEAADPSCKNCGRCCDFRQFGHKLYVTTLEMLYFLHGLHTTQSPLTAPADGKCPYQTKQGCTLRPYRPAGCRIFFCTDLPHAYQQDLCEDVLQSLRQLHDEMAVPYLYTDFLVWLTKLA